ncbi:MAG: hypothetical protein U0X91_07210 [Spirosomataceae bacterium]
MEKILTAEQVKEFEAITDYSKKLKWWQERFDIKLEVQSLPSSRLNHLGILEWHFDHISIYPKNNDEIKIFVEWYPNQMTPIDIRKNIEKDLAKWPKSEWKSYLEKGYNQELQCGFDSISSVWFSIGYNFEENIAEGVKLLYDGITKEQDRHKVVMDFFSGLFVKRLNKAVKEKKNNISDFEDILTKNQNFNLHPLDANSITASQYLFVDYFMVEKIGKPNSSMDDIAYYRSLVRKYGKTEEDFKKAIRRVKLIINDKMTPGQERGVRNDLKTVIKYFSQKEEAHSVKKVEEFSKRIGLNLFE